MFWTESPKYPTNTGWFILPYCVLPVVFHRSRCCFVFVPLCSSIRPYRRSSSRTIRFSLCSFLTHPFSHCFSLTIHHRSILQNDFSCVTVFVYLSYRVSVGLCSLHCSFLFIRPTTHAPLDITRTIKPHIFICVMCDCFSACHSAIHDMLPLHFWPADAILILR